MLTQSMCDIAFKIGCIEGTAQLITVSKDISRKELEEAMERVKKWSIEIKEATKSLTDVIVQESGKN